MPPFLAIVVMVCVSALAIGGALALLMGLT